MRISLLLFVLLIPFSLIRGQELPFTNSQFVEVDSIKLHYRTWGPEQAQKKGNLLFLHGFVSSTYTWRNNCDFFADKGYQVIALDLPAFGYSARPLAYDHSPANLAKLVLHFLEQVTPGEKWHIVGHSTSGSIVTAMALIQPERFNSVTIVDGVIEGIASSGFYDMVSGTLEIGIARKAMSQLASWVLFNESVFTDFLALASFKKPSPEAVQQYIKPFNKGKVKKQAFDLFRIKEPVSEEFYTQQPELNLVWGKRDPWIPISVAKRIQKLTGKGKLYIIPKAGHTPMETHAEEFNGVLLGVLELISKN